MSVFVPLFGVNGRACILRTEASIGRGRAVNIFLVKPALCSSRPRIGRVVNSGWRARERKGARSSLFQFGLGKSLVNPGRMATEVLAFKLKYCQSRLIWVECVLHELAIRHESSRRKCRLIRLSRRKSCDSAQR